MDPAGTALAGSFYFTIFYAIDYKKYASLK